MWKQRGNNANNKRIFNSLAAVIYKNKPNAALSSEKLRSPAAKKTPVVSASTVTDSGGLRIEVPEARLKSGVLW